MAEDKNKQSPQPMRESHIDKQDRSINTNYTEHIRNTDVTTTQKAPPNPFTGNGGNKKDQ
jgi:hypothetical protein